MLREVPELPPKVSGQQPCKLRPPVFLLVGRRWLQPEGGSNLQGLSSPGFFASQALARALAGHAPCCRRIQWGRRRGVRAPRGAPCGQLQWVLHSSEKVAVLGEAEVGQRTRQNTQQGSPRRGTGRDTRALPRAQEQAGWTNGHPRFHPWTEGVLCPHTTLIWVSFQHDIEGHGVQPT